MKASARHAGFTVVELLVASSVLVLVLGVLLSMTDQTQRLVSSTSVKVEQFREARLGFEAMTERLSQATLNTYWDRQFQAVSQTTGGRTTQIKVPLRYERSSDLRFRSGRMAELTRGKGPNESLQPTHGVFFQAPNTHVTDCRSHGALDQLLSTWGYFVELNTDEEFLPPCLKGVIPPRKRYRLMELREPAEKLSVYQFQQQKSLEWFLPSVTGPKRPVHPLADNIVALIVLPRLASADEEFQRRNGGSTILAPGYRYDTTQSARDPNLNTKHQLPPIVRVVMVAIDETSAARLERDYGAQAGLGLDLSDLFAKPEALEDNSDTSRQCDGDLTKLKDLLGRQLRVSYRIFSTDVSIHGAKWSRSQEN